MSNPRCETSFQRQLLPPGLRRTAEFTFDLKGGEASLYLNGFLTELLPEEVWTGDELINIRGRDESLGILPLKQFPKRNELCYIEGSFLFPAHDHDPDAVVGRAVPFAVDAVTDYVPGKGSSVNTFTTSWKGMPALLKGRSPKALGGIFPIKLDGYRIGMLFHNKKHVAHMLGATPILTDYLLIDYSENKLVIIIRNEGVSSKKSDLTLPYSRFPVLDQIVQKVSGTSLNQLYRQSF